ncbi:alpha/beta fold hydrolase [Aggregatilinea lenta]|uniref:alpha/beta fold hydrolase n=1 Tax=Aggregatilinea lenta TaxID=913108 RepID=UPI0013C29FB4|nr:alpha/beta fold hydrolase [Aggregatilinea lenta]
MKRQLRGLKHRTIQLDLDLYRVRVPIKDVPGASLAVVDLWPEAVEQTIMFVHGYAGCAETWEYQVNHFARDYRVVVPDLRGHGQSDAPYTDYTMDEMLRDLQAVVDRLQLPEKFVLVGHSFGGSICVEYANAFPERLERLVLIATAGEYPLPRAVAFAYRVPTLFYRGLWKYRWRWNAELHVMQRMMLNNMRKWRGWPLLRSVRTPTLIIRGERDTYFPNFVYDDVAKLVPGAEVYDVGGAKHKVQIERHEAVNRVIERFIKGKRRSSWRGPTTRTALIEERPWLLNYHPETPYTIPIPRQPLYRFLESAANAVPKTNAILFYNRAIKYQQLNRQVNQLAHALRGLGVQPGDRVMIVLPNVPQMVVAYYAVLKAGGVVVLPYPDAEPEALAVQAGDTGAKVLVTLANFGALIEVMRAQAAIETVVLADLSGLVGPPLSTRLNAQWGSPVAADGEGLRAMADLMHGAPDYNPDIDVPGHHAAVVAYTGGATGTPIGVCLSHTNLVANALQTRHWIPGLNYGRESCLSVMPLAHSYGMTCGMNMPIALGSTMILLPEFDVEQVLDYVKSYRPTVLPGTPSMYLEISHAPRSRAYGLAAVKACLSMGAPLPVEVKEEFEKITRGQLIECYGLTEAGPLTHANPLSATRKAGSVGVPISNTRARIVDPATGAALPAGEVGELAVQGPQVMMGYWKADEPTPAQTTLEADGWLRTGDVGVMDVDGYFQVVGRKQDAIRVDGHVVYPRDVEEVLYENVKVQEAAVVSVRNGDGAPSLQAFVVPKPDTDLTTDELRNLCRRRLDAFAVPDDIVFRPNLPHSSIGRVIKPQLVVHHD